nr:immunoglobulin heavy chain junction region [Mus musculus]NSM07680.1 immunoglobulin heavy chain junction region [Mus musculus]
CAREGLPKTSHYYAMDYW